MPARRTTNSTQAERAGAMIKAIADWSPNRRFGYAAAMMRRADYPCFSTYVLRLFSEVGLCFRPRKIGRMTTTMTTNNDQR